jgi:hypothetical protein
LPGAPELSLKELKNFLRSRKTRHDFGDRDPGGAGWHSVKELYDEINAKAAAAKAAP